VEKFLANMLLLFSGYSDNDEAFQWHWQSLFEKVQHRNLEHTKNSLQVYFNLDPEGEKLITI
jgi:hypothetical protein